MGYWGSGALRNTARWGWGGGQHLVLGGPSSRPAPGAPSSGLPAPARGAKACGLVLVGAEQLGHGATALLGVWVPPKGHARADPRPSHLPAMYVPPSLHAHPCGHTQHFACILALAHGPSLPCMCPQPCKHGASPMHTWPLPCACSSAHSVNAHVCSFPHADIPPPPTLSTHTHMLPVCTSPIPPHIQVLPLMCVLPLTQVCYLPCACTSLPSVHTRTCSLPRLHIPTLCAYTCTLSLMSVHAPAPQASTGWCTLTDTSPHRVGHTCASRWHAPRLGAQSWGSTSAHRHLAHTCTCLVTSASSPRLGGLALRPPSPGTSAFTQQLAPGYTPHPLFLQICTPGSFPVCSRARRLQLLGGPSLASICPLKGAFAPPASPGLLHDTGRGPGRGDTGFLSWAAEGAAGCLPWLQRASSSGGGLGQRQSRLREGRLRQPVACVTPHPAPACAGSMYQPPRPGVQGMLQAPRQELDPPPWAGPH